MQIYNFKYISLAIRTPIIELITRLKRIHTRSAFFFFAGYFSLERKKTVVDRNRESGSF